MAAYDRGDYATAVRGFLVHAEQGDATAQYKLGVMYNYGWGVPEDHAEAVRWYRLAAKQVHQSVAIPDEGLSDAELENLIAEMERLGPRQGHAGAQFNLGLMYANGAGVLKDDAEAVRWYRLAADQGLAGAQLNLGNRYANGAGVLKDDAEAVRWYRPGCRTGPSQRAVQSREQVLHRAGRPQGRCRSGALVPSGRRPG